MTSIPKRGLTVIFKGTSRCDAGCRFCSVGHRTGGTVSQEDFELVVERLEAYLDRARIGRLEFTFHGGEPTLLGADFLDGACRRLKELPVELGLSLQSNLLHWDAAVFEALVAHGVRVGTSFDPLGTSRLDGEGRPAHPRWRENFVRLAALGDAPGAIFVVTRQALGRSAELLQEAAELGAETGRPFGLQLNPVYPQGLARGDRDALLTPQDFGRFLVETWDLWEQRGRDVRVTPIQHFAERLIDGTREPTPLSCSFGGRCGRSHVGIDHELNVAGCGRRLDSGAFLGNLRVAPLWQLLDTSEERGVLATRDAGLRAGACKACRFFELCRGGCPDDATLAGRRLNEPFAWCQGYRALFEAMETRKRRTRLGASRRALRLVADPVLALDRGDTTGLGAWLLPRGDGSNLGFEGGLSRLLASRGQVRVFVHNRHVRTLGLWERQLREGKLQVGLFEAADLGQAIERLEKLGATAWLDVPGILEQAGVGQLGRILARFVHDPGWKTQVQPFSSILRAATFHSLPTPRGAWGFPVGTPVEARLGSEQLEPEAQRILDLAQQAARPLVEWLEHRQPCRACELFSVCGGEFAAGDGQPCSSAARALVARLAREGREIENNLAAACASP